MTPDEAMYIVGIALLIFSAVLFGERRQRRQEEAFSPSSPVPTRIVIHAAKDAMVIIPPMETVMDDQMTAIRVNPDQVEGLMVKYDPSILQRAKAVYNVHVDVPGTYRLTVVSDVPSDQVNQNATSFIPQNKMNTMFISLGDQRQLLTLGTGYSHTKQGTASLTFPTPGVHRVTLSYSPRSGIWGRVARIILELS